MKEKLIGTSRIGYKNRGLYYGENIFSSFSSFEKRVVLFPQHIERLKRGIDFFYPELEKLENRFEEIEDFVERSLFKSEVDLYFRITLVVSLDKKEIAFHVLSKDYNPCSKLDKRLTVVQKNWPESDFKNRSKLGSYADSFYYLDNVRRSNFDDFLKVNKEGYVLEASTSNIIFEKEGVWYTPKKNDSFLSGITLEKIKSTYSEKVIERHINIKEINHFEKAFLTNGVDYFVNITKVDDVAFSRIFIDSESKHQMIASLLVGDNNE